MEKSWAISGIDLHLDVPRHRLRRGVEDSLRAAIRSGRLAAGVRLPASRSLAADLGVSRNTVADAYAQLVAEGWLTARQGSGTRVAERPAKVSGPAAPTVPAHQPRYDLTPGKPDVSVFPRRDWAAAARHALAAVASSELSYTDPLGLPTLRTALAEYVTRVRGVVAEPDRVVVCGGFGQAVGVLGRALAATGVRRVAVEAYGIADHRRALARSGLDLHAVPVDAHGLQVDRLDETDARGVGAVLTTPAHQFPIGSVLAPDRRPALASWAARTAGWVVEDDYDGEFRFDRQPVGAIQPLDPDRIVYAGTASKTLAPGLRLGWLVVPTGLLDAVRAAKHDDPARSSSLDQLTLARMLTSGAYDRQVRRSRLAYRRRRDRLVAVLRRDLPRARVTGIAAGLHLLLTLPPGMTEPDAVARAARHGLAVQGLSDSAFDDRPHEPALVVGFGTPPEHAFSTAVARLVAALR